MVVAIPQAEKMDTCVLIILINLTLTFISNIKFINQETYVYDNICHLVRIYITSCIAKDVTDYYLYYFTIISRTKRLKNQDVFVILTTPEKTSSYDYF